MELIETTANIEIGTIAGDLFSSVFENAKRVAETTKGYVFFNFNGIEIRVKPDTDKALIDRDLDTARLLGWKVVGPCPVADYSNDLKAQIGVALQEVEQRRIERAEAWSRKQESAIAVADEARSRFPIHIYASLRQEYDQWLEAQGDSGYGLAAFEFAKSIAEISQLLAADRGTFIANVISDATRIAVGL